MKKKNNIAAFILVTVMVMLFQLMQPSLVLADGETPPPTDAAIEITPTDLPIADSSLATPVPTDTISTLVDEPASDSPLVDTAETINPTPEAFTDPADAVDLSADQPDLPEILQELPGDTSLVVLDENGQPVSLVTQAAAEIIANGDPMWCPAADITVTANCVNAPTVGALLLMLASKDEDGVIYFFTPTPYNTNDVTFDSSDLNIDQLADNSLTLQGGWNGNTTLGSTIAYSGNSVFNVPITITGWNNDIVLNNITVTGAVGKGLDLYWSSGDVVINNSTFSRNADMGVYIDTTETATISNTTITGNTVLGTFIEGGANVIVTNSTLNSNGVDAYFFNVSGVSITNSTFGNLTAGIVSNDVFVDSSFINGGYIYMGSNVTISNSTFNGSTANGLRLEDVNNVVLNNSIFRNNANSGIYIDTAKNISIASSVFDTNGTGIYASVNSAKASTLSVSSSIFSQNKVAIWTDATSAGSAITLAPNCNTYNNNQQNIKFLGNTTLLKDPCEEDSPSPTPIVTTASQLDIAVPAGAEFIEYPIECFNASAYHFFWGGGDEITLSCVVDAVVRISPVDSTSLAHDLPSGFQYVSSFNVELFQNGTPVHLMSESGYINFSLVSNDNDLSNGIMAWDESENKWVLLQEYQLDSSGLAMTFPFNPSDPGNGYKILKGAQHLTGYTPHRNEVTTNFMGIYVLVQQ